MNRDNNYRHELKYRISYLDYLSIRSRLRAVMQADPHARNGTYLVRSVYFDNVYDKALREKTDGIGKREKFRIRYYNDDLSYITLEKKMKIGRLCLKCDESITESEFRRILDGDIEWMKDSPSELVKELYAKMRYQGLKPRVRVSYVREPYIYKAGNVRVTFDSQIRTSMNHNDFINADDISATEYSHEMLMEVKYDAFIPRVIQDMIQMSGGGQEAFSKYGTCRRYG
ncbi:MAG: polyphosphate polymerase domain-containing protein [Lachnospiraceae bacterium]|nr:polyphosphate polymerase domain-containing protein [Lachnospiraceae bacterium]